MDLDQPSWFKLEFFYFTKLPRPKAEPWGGGLGTETLTTPPKPNCGANNVLSKNHHHGGLVHALSKPGCFFFHYYGV
jgi:hypothetical protein